MSIPRCILSAFIGPADSRERSSDNNAPQYRPWESVDGGPLPPGTPKEVLLRTGFSGVMGNSQPPPDLQQPVSKLPSFQSQFNAFQVCQKYLFELFLYNISCIFQHDIIYVCIMVEVPKRYIFICFHTVFSINLAMFDIGTYLFC